MSSEMGRRLRSNLVKFIASLNGGYGPIVDLCPDIEDGSCGTQRCNIARNILRDIEAEIEVQVAARVAERNEAVAELAKQNAELVAKLEKWKVTEKNKRKIRTTTTYSDFARNDSFRWFDSW